MFQVENSLSTYEPHACVVVYSIVDRATFRTVEDILNYLWRENYTQEKSVIVVGNKADLARSRVIPTNGKNCISVAYTVRSDSRCALLQKVLEVTSTSIYTGLNPFNFISKHFLQICL
jgi:hypothetical protein